MATEKISTSIIDDDAVTGDKIENNPTVAGNLSVGGTATVTGASTFSGGIANTGTITAGTLGSSVVFPGPASGSFGGHILQANIGARTFTADNVINTTSEVFGPVVSMQMIQANAKVIAILNLGEMWSNNASYSSTISLAYKTSSFTAGDGTTSHGATVLTDIQGIWRRASYSSIGCFVLGGTLSNTANQTIYFAGEGVTAGGDKYLNYAGGSANCVLTVFEIKT